MQRASVSILVPMYKGKKYVKSILNQVKRCAMYSLNVRIELVLYNDYPQELIEVEEAELGFFVCVINGSKNVGIHRARVEALNHSTGEYVIFLDQDDKIREDYFEKQLHAIVQKDVVVCGCIHENRQYYDERRPMPRVITKEKIIGEYNYIVSPGQVLIRRSAIPEIWKQSTLKINGADDWLLWILMFGSNRSFAINEEVLFEHVVDNYSNASLNTWRMYESEKEVLSIVKGSNLLKPVEVEMLEQAINNILKTYLCELDKMRKSFHVCNRWIRQINAGMVVWNQLRKSDIQSIAIYGCNDIARNFCEALENQGFEVRYYIDMNARYLNEEKPVFSLQDKLEEVDLIIIALVEYEKEIKSELEKIGFKNISIISELL